MTPSPKLRRLYPGCFRVTLGREGQFFGQVRKAGRARWEAELRATETGALIQFLGVWGTRALAVQEAAEAAGAREARDAQLDAAMVALAEQDATTCPRCGESNAGGAIAPAGRFAGSLVCPSCL